MSRSTDELLPKDQSQDHEKLEKFDICPLVNQWSERKGSLFKELSDNLRSEIKKLGKKDEYGFFFSENEDNRITLQQSHIEGYKDKGLDFAIKQYEKWLDMAILELAKPNKMNGAKLEKRIGIKESSQSEMDQQQERLLEKLKQEKLQINQVKNYRELNERGMTLLHIDEALEDVLKEVPDSTKKHSRFSFFSFFKQDNKSLPKTFISEKINEINKINDGFDPQKLRDSPLARLDAIKDIYKAVCDPTSQFSRLKNKVFRDKKTNQFCEKLAKMIEEKHPDAAREVREELAQSHARHSDRKMKW